MGDCSTNCNPCGPSYDAINQLATQTKSYARQALSAVTTVEEFQSLYLGAKATAPTTDNEGNPLQVGALYFNTTDGEMYVWAGSAWEFFGQSGFYLGPKASNPTTDNEGNPLVAGLLYFNTVSNMVRVYNGISWQNVSFDETTPFIATGTTTPRNLVTRFADVVNVKDFGAVGDYYLSDGSINPNPTDDTVAFQNFVNKLNSQLGGGIGYVPAGGYLVSAGTIVLTRHGSGIFGAGRGNAANINPNFSPTTLVFKGEGSGIRVIGQSVKLVDFGITSDSTRGNFSTGFKINSPGIRVEPEDIVPNSNGGGRADRCYMNMLRITNQPGDGILLVGSTIYHDISNIDIYTNRGFGIRFDDGSWTGITRTNKSYHGFGTIHSCRIGYNYGQPIAIANPTVFSQTFMGLRHRIYNVDMFGNTGDTSICYGPAPDGNYYSMWMFCENTEIVNCGIPGDHYDFSTQTGYSETRGGLYIGGRDNYVTNCRINRTLQPIYFFKNPSQESSGLKVKTPRMLNNPGTLHTNLVEIQNIDCTGVDVEIERYDFIVNPTNPRIGQLSPQNKSVFRNTLLNTKGTFDSGGLLALENNKAVKIELDQASSSVSVFGMMQIACSTIDSGGGIFQFRVGGSVGGGQTGKMAGNANTIIYGPTGTGALNGTTGSAGSINISCDDTSIYIENRRGFLIGFNIFLSATNTYTSVKSITYLP